MQRDKVGKIKEFWMAKSKFNHKEKGSICKVSKMKSDSILRNIKEIGKKLSRQFEGPKGAMKCHWQIIFLQNKVFFMCIKEQRATREKVGSQG